MDLVVAFNKRELPLLYQGPDSIVGHLVTGLWTWATLHIEKPEQCIPMRVPWILFFYPFTNRLSSPMNTVKEGVPPCEG